MNSNVRKITDGAMMCAIVGAVLLINRQLGGLFQDMFLFLFPIPMVFYSAKYGWKNGWVVFAAMCLLGFILGGPTTLFYVASEMCAGENSRKTPDSATAAERTSVSLKRRQRRKAQDR